MIIGSPAVIQIHINNLKKNMHKFASSQKDHKLPQKRRQHKHGQYNSMVNEWQHKHGQYNSMVNEWS
jgi:hypothetical protein